MTDMTNNPADAAPDITVLYIEDNPVNLTLIRKIVENKTSHNFISATNPLKGLELAVAEKPDIILLDIFLPQMDGYEVLSRLMQDPATSDIPVIALSANAMQADVERGMQAGFKAYLSKPIDVTNFLDVLEGVLKSA